MLLGLTLDVAVEESVLDRLHLGVCRHRALLDLRLLVLPPRRDVRLLEHVARAAHELAKLLKRP